MLLLAVCVATYGVLCGGFGGGQWTGDTTRGDHSCMMTWHVTFQSCMQRIDAHLKTRCSIMGLCCGVCFRDRRDRREGDNGPLLRSSSFHAARFVPEQWYITLERIHLFVMRPSRHYRRGTSPQRTAWELPKRSVMWILRTDELRSSRSQSTYWAHVLARHPSTNNLAQFLVQLTAPTSLRRATDREVTRINLRPNTLPLTALPTPFAAFSAPLARG